MDNEMIKISENIWYYSSKKIEDAVLESIRLNAMIGRMASNFQLYLDGTRKWINIEYFFGKFGYYKGIDKKRFQHSFDRLYKDSRFEFRQIGIKGVDGDYEQSDIYSNMYQCRALKDGKKVWLYTPKISSGEDSLLDNWKVENILD